MHICEEPSVSCLNRVTLKRSRAAAEPNVLHGESLVRKYWSWIYDQNGKSDVPSLGMVEFQIAEYLLGLRQTQNTCENRFWKVFPSKIIFRPEPPLFISISLNKISNILQ